MSAAFDLLPLLVLAVLPVLFIIQFFNAHSRSAAWATPTRTTLAPVSTATVIELDDARGAREARTLAAA